MSVTLDAYLRTRFVANTAGAGWRYKVIRRSMQEGEC